MLISSSVGRGCPSCGGGSGLSSANLVLFCCSESSLSTRSRLLCFGNNNLCFSRLIFKSQIKSCLCFTFQCLGNVSINKDVSGKQVRLSDFVTLRLISQRYCYNGEYLTKANLLKVIYINSRSVLLVSGDYVVLFILGDTFFSESFHCTRCNRD